MILHLDVWWGLNKVSSAVSYEYRHTGELVVFNINQDIQFNSMIKSLLCVMQLRMNGLRVFEYPNFLIGIINVLQPDIMGTPLEDENKIVVPLSLHGVMFYFPQGNQLYKGTSW